MTETPPTPGAPLRLTLTVTGATRADLARALQVAQADALYLGHLDGEGDGYRFEIHGVAAPRYVLRGPFDTPLRTFADAPEVLTAYGWTPEGEGWCRSGVRRSEAAAMADLLQPHGPYLRATFPPCVI